MAFSVNNLQYWANNELVIRQTLELFNELASGYCAKHYQGRGMKAENSLGTTASSGTAQ